MRPILLEIVTSMITTLGQCRSCEVIFQEAGLSEKVSQKEVNEYPQDLVQESEKLSDLIRQLKQLYRHRLSIKLIDAKSFLGVYKSLRHWVRKYPTFIVEGKETYSGWDKDQIEVILDKYIKASIPSKHRTFQPTLP